MKLPKGYVPGYGVHKATAYGGFGQKMMEKMGWEKGKGLGRNADGMTQAIEVKEKKDTLGVSDVHTITEASISKCSSSMLCLNYSTGRSNALLGVVVSAATTHAACQLVQASACPIVTRHGMERNPECIEPVR